MAKKRYRAEEIEEANLARRERKTRKEREERRQGVKAETHARIQKEIRTYLEANEGEEISTRELRENIQGKNNTLAGVLKEMAGQGRLRRRKKGKQKVLWSLAGGEEGPLETGSPASNSPLTEEKRGTGISLTDTKSYAVKRRPVPSTSPLRARERSNEGTGWAESAENELGKGTGGAPQPVAAVAGRGPTGASGCGGLGAVAADPGRQGAGGLGRQGQPGRRFSGHPPQGDRGG